MLRKMNDLLFRSPVAPILAVCLPMSMAQANEEEPSAIVDDLSDSVTAVELMDYLFPGQEITLADGDTLQIGYLDSCVVEVITGGTVVVGKEQSEVTGGAVEREAEGCGGTASVEAADDEAVIGLSAVFRDIDKSAFTGDEAPEANADGSPSALIVYSQFPAVVAGPDAMELTVQRLDKTEKPLSALMFGGKFDFARRNVKLEKGAAYRFVVADKSQVVFVSKGAGGQDVPVPKRLVRLDK